MPVTVALVYSSLLDVGGVETHLLSLLRHGDPSRYRWLILSSTSSAFAGQARALGAQVVPWQPAHPFDVVSLIHLSRMFRLYSVDLIHAHSPRASLFGRIAARLIGRPAVVTVHLPPYYYARELGLGSQARRCIYRSIERFLNNRLTDRLIYVSSQVYQDALALGVISPDRATVIENGIDLASYQRNSSCEVVRQALDTPLEMTVLCCVGRLARQKGFDVLLEACPALKPGGRAWRIWLIGDGSEREALEAQVRRLGLEECVRFLGFRSDVPELLKASDIFVLPSRDEAMSMALLEAMAAGLPCAVTDVGDNARLVENGVSGWVVPPEAPQALANALNGLILDPTLCRTMGQAARSKAQQYDVRRMVARTLAVYEQVLGKRCYR